MGGWGSLAEIGLGWGSGGVIGEDRGVGEEGSWRLGVRVGGVVRDRGVSHSGQDAVDIGLEVGRVLFSEW